MYRIAIVEDDLHIGGILEELLRREGYQTLRAYSGTEARLLLEKETPDLILLDLMLPGMTGEELLPAVRRIPTIVVSAKVDPDDKAKLLLDGAADYVTKPFHSKELLARIAVQLRRGTGAERELLRYDAILLDTVSHKVTVDGVPVHLTRTEYAILKLLMQNAERAVSKSAILDAIALDTPDCTETSLKIHISNLRKKLRSTSGSEWIEAVWGIGFRLGRDIPPSGSSDTAAAR